MSDKPLTERLQVKHGRSILLVDEPKEYLTLLEPLPEGSRIITAGGTADIVQIFVDSMTALKVKLPSAVGLLKPNGILWVTYPKLTSKLHTDINRDSIYQYGLTIGWQGIAIISINETWSALRLKPL